MPEEMPSGVNKIVTKISSAPILPSFITKYFSGYYYLSYLYYKALNIFFCNIN
jgi:hypothetical protein